MTSRQQAALAIGSRAFAASNAIREKRHRDEWHSDPVPPPPEKKPLPGRRALPLIVTKPAVVRRQTPMEAKRTTVVNLRREAFDVYIGRAGHGQDGYFGNPFRLKREDQREATLDRYRASFLARVASDPEFRRRVLALHGKRLGCFCKPAACHGDVIAAWVNANAPAKRRR